MVEYEATGREELIHIKIGGLRNYREDETLTITLQELLKVIPTPMARLEYLLSEIRRVRAEKIGNLGNYMQIIIDLTKGEQKIRQKMIEAGERGDLKAIKSYTEIVKAYLTEKNTLVEFRHAQKFLTLEEGRLENELSKIEV